MLRAVLKVETPFADTILASLTPEAGREIPRTKVHAEREGGAVVLRVEATDVSAMRAALNSYLRWMVIAENMSKTIGETHG
ncbi:MAG: hypothetical protein HPY73_07925 [Methanomassiliicoccales archaeon]|nr:MAG: hypothetical protein HPY73_07925 [Methanomassiliicoccales archaeon]